MKYSHVFLDFDETLFDHASYVAWADAELVSRLGIEQGTYKRAFDEFHTQLEDPNLRLFRHQEHMLHTTGKPWDYVSGELESARNVSDDFCYEDVHEFLDWLMTQDVDVRILTFGDADYQRYKINTCSKLKYHNVPVHVVFELKRQFLAREFGAGTRGLLVDDKHPLNLPTNWDHAWINRGSVGNKSQPTKHSVIQIHSLSQLVHTQR